MIKLGDNVFVVPPPGGMRSFVLQQRILPVFGRIANVFLMLLNASEGSIGKLADMDVMGVLPQAIPYLGKVFADMPEGELEAITRELLRDASCDKVLLFGGAGGDMFEAKLQGRTMDTWKLLWHALQVWYPDVFTLARSLKGKGERANPSGESNTSEQPGLATA